MRNRYLFTSILVTATLACGGDDGPKGSSAGSARRDAASVCAQACKRAEAADCPNEFSCEAQCRSTIDETPTACDAELDAYATCATRAKFACDDEGEAAAIGCDTQLEKLGACIEGASSGRDAGTSGRDAGTSGRDGGTAPQSDAGTTGRDAGQSSAGLCAETASDNACSACYKGSCCAEITACGADCQEAQTCIVGCGDDDACGTRCLQQASPTGLAQLEAALSCLTSSCADACTGEEDLPAGDDSSGPALPEGDCLPRGSVPPGHCNVAGKPNAYECVRAPFPSCVPSPTGVSDIYCCAE